MPPGVALGEARPARHPFHPARQPQQAAQSQGDEERPPAEARHEDAAHQRAQRRSDFRAGVDQCIRQSALMLVEMRGQDLRITRISHRLPNPEQQPQDQQHRESVDQAGGGRGHRPEEESHRENPVHVKAIHQPAGQDLARGVGPKERGKQYPQLRRRDSQFIFEQRRRNGEIPAIDVVDGDGENQQDYHASQGARNSGSKWSRGRSHGCSFSSCGSW